MATLFARTRSLERKPDRVEGRLRRGRVAGGDCSGLHVGGLGCPQTDDLTNHQAYVANWLEALRKDNRYIFRAGTAANKAADLRPVASRRQPEPEPAEVAF